MTVAGKLRKAQREEDLRIIQNLRLMDDDFMKICFDKNIPAVEYMLSILLPHLELHILRVKTEYVISNLKGRGVRLDIYAKDKNGIPFDIEIQRADEGANPRRARYNASMLDTRLRLKKKSYKNLPDAYVIFITESDVIGGGLPIYTVERTISYQNQRFEDGSHILYVNGAYEGDDPIGHLMQDFRARKTSEMTDSPLKDSVGWFKESKGGIKTMCKAFEKIRRDAEKVGRKEGAEQGRLELLKELVADGTLTISAAAKKLDIPVSTFRKKAKL